VTLNLNAREILEKVKVRQLEFSRKNGFEFSAKKEYVGSNEHGNKIDKFNKSSPNCLSHATFYMTIMERKGLLEA
jgi:hypothetical protein